MFIKNKNSVFGRYPSCDILNNAIKFLHDGKTEEAMSEIILAIEKANGYFYEDIADIVSEFRDKKSV